MKKIYYFSFLLLLVAGNCGKGSSGDQPFTFIQDYSGERATPQELLLNRLSKSLQSSPRLIIGRIVPECFHMPNDYEEKAIDGIKFFISKEKGVLYYDSDRGPRDMRLYNTVKKTASKEDIKDIRAVGRSPRELRLRKGDFTVDIKEPHLLRNNDKAKPHVQGDAWTPATIEKIKNIQNGQFGAIVFERVGMMPLDWGAYIKQLLSAEKPAFYQLPAPPMCGHPDPFGAYYKKNYHFYHPVVEKVTLPNQLSSPVTAISNLAALVNTVAPNSATLSEERNNGAPPDLQEILHASDSADTAILKAYYDLLKPGGLFIFMSSSNAINRHGGCIFQHQEKYYSPFQDLDDPSMKAVYRSLLKRAGFKDVRFYKDPYFMEDVIFVTAKK